MSDKKKRAKKHKTTDKEKEAHAAREGVGYCSPPEHGKIRPGERRSPGRPKGAKNVRTLLAEELERTIVVKVEGQPQTITKLDALIRKVVVDGLTKNAASQKLLLDLIGQLVGLGGQDGDDALTQEEEVFRGFLLQRRKQLEEE